MTLALNKPKLDNLASDIWKSAERLRGKFKAYEYQNVILPIIVIRRLECVLIAWREAKRSEVLAKRPNLTEVDLDKLVKDLELNPRQSPFSNKTAWTLRKVYEEDHTLLEENFRVDALALRAGRRVHPVRRGYRGVSEARNCQTDHSLAGSAAAWLRDSAEQVFLPISAADAGEGFALGVLAAGKGSGDLIEGAGPMKRKDTALQVTPEYRGFIEDLKARVFSARLSAARAVNRDLILLYWDIGRAIADKQEELGWGESVVKMVASDLRSAFPGTTGFSPQNVWRMLQFYRTHADERFLSQVVREWTEDGKAAPTPEKLSQLVREMVATVPWGHHANALAKVAGPAARLYYLRATARFGWSRNVLLNQIKAGAYERAVAEKKTHNFELALPEHLAEQADEMLKSSYNLEFLGIHQAVKERELEDRLIERLRDFLLELGYGFCFVGRQYRLALGDKEYFIDLLFYHRFLKALVAFELKVGPFEPEYAGKMDFYLNLLNDRESGPDDNPSIGVILCAEKDDVEVEYALRTKRNPIGVAEYHLQSRLPADLKGKLPTARQLADVVRTALPENRRKRS